MGYDVTVSVATPYGGTLAGEQPGLRVRVGRLDTAQMALLLADGGFGAVIDATHPYAVEVSRNIRAACAAAQVRCVRLLRRESGAAGFGRFGTLAEAVAAAGRCPGNLLATTGSKEIGLYAAVPEFRSRVFARVLPVGGSIEACRAAGLDDAHIIAARGPFSTAQNLRDLRAHEIRLLVTKDGGGAGGFAEKLEAAKVCGVRVFVVRRPPDEGLSYDEVLELLRRGFSCTSA